MTFLDPKFGFVFKKLFGDQTKSEIINSFLNSILGKEDGEKITNTTIIDPSRYPDFDDIGKTILDVKCIDQTGNAYVIEMQVAGEDDYWERCQYRNADAFYNQLAKKQKYAAIKPVIFIGIVNYNILKTHKTRYLSHKKIHAVDWYFIELQKFTKKLDELKTIDDKWIYLFKEAERLKTIPKEFKNPPELHAALEALEEGAFTPVERDRYERAIDYFRVTHSQYDTAVEEAIKKALRAAENTANRAKQQYN